MVLARRNTHGDMARITQQSIEEYNMGWTVGIFTEMTGLEIALYTCLFTALGFLVAGIIIACIICFR